MSLLSVLDQSPISEGSTGGEALRNSIDLAQLAECLRYQRDWIAEHHATPFARLLHRKPEEEVLAECEREGMPFLPFFPLKSGLLTGKYRKGQPIPQDTRVAKYERYNKLLTEENLDKVEALIEFAESRQRTLLELAFS